MKCSFVGLIAALLAFSGAICCKNVSAQLKNSDTKKPNSQTQVVNGKFNKPHQMLLPVNRGDSITANFKCYPDLLMSLDLSGSYHLKLTDNYDEQEKLFGVAIWNPLTKVLIAHADTFDLDLFKSSTLEVRQMVDCKFVSIHGGTFHNSNLAIRAGSANYEFCAFDGSVLSSSAKTQNFTDCKFDSTTVVYDFSEGDSACVKFENCIFKSNIEIRLSDTTYFLSPYMPNSIQLTHFGERAAYIYLEEIDLNILKFPDEGIRFIVIKDQKYQRQIRLYKQLIEHFSDIKEEKMVYDIQLQKLVNEHENKRLVDWIEENWSNYGYDKNLIFRNSLYLMLFFFLMNLFVFRYPRILYNGYEIQEFITADQRITDKYPRRWQYQVVKAALCLVYTGYIFWGVKLSVDKIKLSNLTVTIWIITQYVTGIICLAYIANVIITKV